MIQYWGVYYITVLIYFLNQVLLNYHFLCDILLASKLFEKNKYCYLYQTLIDKPLF